MSTCGSKMYTFLIEGNLNEGYTGQVEEISGLRTEGNSYHDVYRNLMLLLENHDPEDYQVVVRYRYIITF